MSSHAADQRIVPEKIVVCGATLLLALVAGGCSALQSEGDACGPNAQCANPNQDLACFYGTCRKVCGPATTCGSGRSCTCGAGWAPVSVKFSCSAGPNCAGSDGVCLPTCKSDGDCGGMKSCAFLSVAQQRNNLSGSDVNCTPVAGHCGPDGFCHAGCSSAADCNPGATTSADHCGCDTGLDQACLPGGLVSFQSDAGPAACGLCASSASACVNLTACHS